MDALRRAELERRDMAASQGGRPRRPKRRPRSTAAGFGCGNCDGVLPTNPPRRNVPRRGGRMLPVCHACVSEIDAQTQLFARGIAQVDRAVNHFEQVTGRRRTQTDTLALLREVKAV